MIDDLQAISISLLEERAWSALNQNDWKTALSLISSVETVPQTSEFSKLACCVYLQAGRWSDLAGFASSAAQRFPEQPVFWELWAWAEYMQGDLSAAIRIMERVVDTFCHRKAFAYILAFFYASLDGHTHCQNSAKLSLNPLAFSTKGPATEGKRVVPSDESFLSE